MKARQHLALGIFIIFIFMFIDLYTGNQILTGFMAKTGLNVLTFFVGIVLFVVGLILPDSDSKDAGSKIFYTYFFIFGWINKLLEFPISKLLGRPKGHRESLHTILGITMTSIFFAIIISIILYFDKSFQLFTIPFLFLCLFFGQIIHLLGDWHWSIK
ncbi:MAG TPA: metal-dependent hydrolase [Candidatus Nanoarchaeia archaeon]|nr:metal-dependent hydrolase [Candidatus Nanoarchaeia archaeon]